MLTDAPRTLIKELDIVKNILDLVYFTFLKYKNIIINVKFALFSILKLIP
jgi:hypothetical protein